LRSNFFFLSLVIYYISSSNLSYSGNSGVDIIRNENSLHLINHLLSHSSFSDIKPPPPPPYTTSNHSRYSELSGLARSFRMDELDVDHMSYEELLQLEEEIGSVNTGISKSEFDSLEKAVIKKVYIDSNFIDCND
jgi:hypothetical protein